MKQVNAIRKNQGFSLLEALIGFFILSVGMLGVASLQAVSLKASQTSVYNSVAMMKVDELFESMRSNPTALATYVGSGADNQCSGSNVCTNVQLANDDVFWWKKNLKSGLPATVTSTVTVTAPTAPSALAVVEIEITWAERDKGSTDSVSKTYSTATNICTAVPC